MRISFAKLVEEGCETCEEFHNSSREQTQSGPTLLMTHL